MNLEEFICSGIHDLVMEAATNAAAALPQEESAAAPLAFWLLDVRLQEAARKVIREMEVN